MSRTTVRKRNARKRLFRAQDGLCHYCRKRMKLTRHGVGAPNEATLDHVIPRSKGGAAAPTLNCVAACFQCNNERGNQDAEQFKLTKQGAL